MACRLYVPAASLASIGDALPQFDFGTKPAAHRAMTMDMTNAAVKVPVTVLTAEVMESPTAWPSVVARLRMPRSLPASSFHCRHRSLRPRWSANGVRFWD